MFSPLHLSSLATQKIFEIILLDAQWIVIPARMVVPCSLEQIWIAQSARHKPQRQNSYHGITLIVINHLRGLNRWRICQNAKFPLVSNE